MAESVRGVQEILERSPLEMVLGWNLQSTFGGVWFCSEMGVLVCGFSGVVMASLVQAGLFVRRRLSVVGRFFGEGNVGPLETRRNTGATAKPPNTARGTISNKRRQSIPRPSRCTRGTEASPSSRGSAPPICAR